MIEKSSDISLHCMAPEREEFLSDVLEGLSRPKKTLPCKYFYDEQGSRLFNRICATDEYYLTRTELAIMRNFAGEMAGMLGEECLLVEYGSGSGEKTRLLLDHIKNPAGYVPIDISKEHLEQTAQNLKQDYPHLDIMAVCADFTNGFHIPVPENHVRRKVIYFPGSTIGNFSSERARKLLENISSHCEPGDGLLIGIDLKKDKATLTRAYNDRQGVTKAFNLNLLRRINRELGADFEVGEFCHKAFYNEGKGRIEMHLVSCQDQKVKLNGSTITFAEGETIHTESSHKYDIQDFCEMAARAHFEFKKAWKDKDHLFGVVYFRKTS